MKKSFSYLTLKKIIKIFKNPLIEPPDMEEDFLDIYRSCYKYTMTSIERMYSLYTAVKYISENGLKGDICECGVWKGGSMMLAAKTLLKLKDKNRKIYLYDTYTGMSRPTKKDIDFENIPAEKEWRKRQRENFNEWAYCPLEETKNNLLLTGYPEKKLVFIKGNVEETIPDIVPNQISLLRLDTDWYKSTYHELKYLYPRIIKQGVLIIDDYGHFKGAKEATEQYFKENNKKVLLNRIDYSGRIILKVD